MSRQDELVEYVATLEEIEKHRLFNKLAYYEPLPKLMEFHASAVSFRAIFAANQIGKSTAGAAETAMHLTGQYASWWTGRRFRKPIEAWACGEGGIIVRDVSQQMLFGKPGLDEEVGTGFVPKDKIKGYTRSHGVTGAYDFVNVEHMTDGKVDGVSTIAFKSYDQGRTKFQAKSLDFFWADEQPPEDIYNELIMRVSATGGCGILTFTPLQGRGPVVDMFQDSPSPDRWHTTLTIWDGHLARTKTREEIQAIIDGVPAYQRPARIYGIPSAGEGAVFPHTPESLFEPQMMAHKIPREWAKIGGMDFGYNHPFAWVVLLWDRDLDVVHVWNGNKIKNQTPLQHVPQILQVAADVPFAWPHDGEQHSKDTGEELHEVYLHKGVRMLPMHAQWPSGGNSFEAGLIEMEERMATGRLKVSEMFLDWHKEMRQYHRKDGKVVKENDDLLSATRYGLMMLRYAKPVNLGAKRSTSRGGSTSGSSFDIFTGEEIHG